MNKKIIGLLMAAMLIPTGYANARGGHHGGSDYGRVIGYTAAAVVTAGVVGALCCSSNRYDRRDYEYDRYQRAQYEQARYEAAMRDRYYAQPVYYAPARPVYYAPPQPVYYQPVYVQQRPVYYGY